MSFEAHVLQNIDGKLCLINEGRDKFNLGGLSEIIFWEETETNVQPPFQFQDTYSVAQQNDIYTKSFKLFPNIPISENVNTYYILCSPESADFKETITENDAGIIYEQVLTLNIPKDRPDLLWLKYKMRRGRYLFIYRDMNGLAKAIGRPLEGLRVKFDLDTKKKPSGYNGHIMTARRSSRVPAPFLDIAPTAALTSAFTI